MDFGSDVAEVPLRASEFASVRSEEGEVMDRWKSPIDLQMFEESFATKILEDQTGCVVKTCVKMGVNVDKEELLKALAYDRDQYEKGYSDGRWARDSEIVRCKNCKHLSSDRIAPEWNRICRKYGVGKSDDGFCDEVERKETENANNSQI